MSPLPLVFNLHAQACHADGPQHGTHCMLQPPPQHDTHLSQSTLQQCVIKKQGRPHEDALMIKEWFGTLPE